MDLSEYRNSSAKLNKLFTAYVALRGYNPRYRSALLTKAPIWVLNWYITRTSGGPPVKIGASIVYYEMCVH